MATICQSLVQCRTLLEASGESFWSVKIEALNAERDDGFDARKLDEILSWFGGMGSFSDLVIAKINGHDVVESEEPKVNARLRALQSDIYNGAAKLRRLKSVQSVTS